MSIVSTGWPGSGSCDSPLSRPILSPPPHNNCTSKFLFSSLYHLHPVCLLEAPPFWARSTNRHPISALWALFITCSKNCRAMWYWVGWHKCSSEFRRLGIKADCWWLLYFSRLLITLHFIYFNCSRGQEIGWAVKTAERPQIDLDVSFVGP